jgi:hypothetical protein
MICGNDMSIFKKRVKYFYEKRSFDKERIDKMISKQKWLIVSMYV